MSRPAIGICAAVERARFGTWDQPVTLLPRGYADAVQAAGGIALLLAPDDDAAEHPAELLDRLDGLMLAGGRDIDPLTYGARPDSHAGEPSPERDRFELALVSAALERDMPVLGVCRGMQMLNVACGGTLVQHLEGDLLARHRHTPGVFSDHDVTLEPGSLAARAAGADQIAVRSHHHQALGELGEGLVATGRSPEDGIVEAVELPAKRFALGVLWHPEEDAASGVIGTLVRAAGARAVTLPQAPSAG
ncbi:MAG: putative glutamine amidotransferase [Thermoleophilaceae bacterium]|nr:putative glutamine amidotransferase [Thermoleophilaceae bacterium]